MFGFKKKDGTPKKKEKMVFAKSKKEVVIMVVVLSAFFANSAYMIYKYTHNTPENYTTAPIQEALPGSGVGQ